ncbi:MAG: transposase [Oligoflexia bacterium]|nr:transposase [Oligoflexia bacterium]
MNEISSTKVVRNGHFFRTADSKRIQRYRCLHCKCSFSKATSDLFYRHRKRRKHHLLTGLLCSGVSQRRAAKLLNIDPKTVARKFHLLALKAQYSFRSKNLMHKKAERIEFDDLETFEHSKCKPLSVTLVVESKTRRILEVAVSSMPAKGLLAKKARQRYGLRKDQRAQGRRYVFSRLKDLVEERVKIKSDSNPHYRMEVEKFFPLALYTQVLGKRGSLGGQGELKKVRFDPLFSLNHTCAKFRADINRLIRKTWCTTKMQRGLYDHLILYADYHNRNLPSPHY